MTDINDIRNNGGPAFPASNQAFLNGTMGMTLRDWFAGQAMAGVIAPCANDARKPGETIEEMFSRKAYAIADAMIAEREK